MAAVLIIRKVIYAARMSFMRLRVVSRLRDLQLEDKAHVLLELEGVVELQQAGVLQGPHDVHFALHIAPVLLARHRHELGGQRQPRGLLATPEHRAELTPGKQKLTYYYYYTYY